MIIECKSCSKKFKVRDSDIPINGRTVQCGNCSEEWFQLPVLTSITTVKTNENLAEEEELEASDGKTYTFLGKQWAELLPSGKTGMLATKRITIELNKLTQKEIPNIFTKIDQRKKYRKRKIESDSISKVIDPSSEQFDIKKTKQGLGFFGYIFLIIIIGFSTVGVLKTFEENLLNYFPETEYIFELLDEQLEFLAESVKNIIIIIDDLINYY